MSTVNCLNQNVFFKISDDVLLPDFQMNDRAGGNSK